MTSMHTININTYLLIALFAIAYLIFIARKTAHQQLDLYDFVMLSMVAVVPATFTFWPSIAYWLAALAGVAFPFVIMFGALFLILFLFAYRLTVHMHKLEKDNLLLLQEVSLLRMELDSRADKINS
jgi:hypothetical protein